MEQGILFLLKKRQVYDNNQYSTLNSGLYNSCKFIVDMLEKDGVGAELEQVVDGNDIDRVVTLHQPSVVILEAIWSPPSKFEILQKLHPEVKWIVRIHSDLPFLANEGEAIKMLKEYEKYENVFIAGNSKYFVEAMEGILDKPVLYFPNYYPLEKEYLRVMCGGALRPMKNSLTQAIAAIKLANKRGLKLQFFINSGRIEQKGDSVLKNIRALFEGTPHELHEVGWLDHKDFVSLMKTMDLSMQISLSESYNIVTADAVANNIPCIGSSEIPFLSKFSKVKNTKDIEEIVRKCEVALDQKYWLVPLNRYLLECNSDKAERQIIKVLNHLL